MIYQSEILILWQKLDVAIILLSFAKGRNNDREQNIHHSRFLFSSRDVWFVFYPPDQRIENVVS